MLQIKLIDEEIKKDIIFPLQRIEFSDNIKSNFLTLHFNSDDGVSFDIKINNKYNNGFKYIYTIPRGMSGGTYHITLKDNNGYISNEVILNVEKNIIKYNVVYNNKEIIVKCFNDVYENKFYLCVDELNELFIGTNKFKKFERISINKLMINDIERRYYSYKHINKLFIYINDIKNIYDIDFLEKDNLIIISDRNKVNIKKLDEELYFSYLHGCLLGDIDSGEIIYSKNDGSACAIASTTKLLTLYLVREKIEEGFFNYESLIEIPEESEYESLSEDGVIFLEKGKKVPLKELLIALMLPSSNESAITLACSVLGSEKDFVRLMNKKCAELGLSSSKFYNASGLPYYENKLSPVKLQNTMSAKDMFKLVSVIVKKYPDLLEITSIKKCYLETLDVTLTNTNPLLFNMEECVGLKTGTTNRAGCCLVSLCVFKGKRIVSIVFGAENSSERGEVSETLMKYAKGLCSYE